MSDAKNDLSRDFEPVNNPADAMRLLKEGGRMMASVILWTKNQESVLNTHITLFKEAEQSIYIWVPKDLDPERFIASLKARNDLDCFFSVSLPTANIFFKARFTAHEDTVGLRFNAPEKIYKVQRRKDMRFQIQDGYVVRVEFQDPLFEKATLSKKVLDVSAGGISILVSADDAPMFQNGMVLKNMTFSIAGKKIQCEGEIRHIRPMPANSRNPGTKIGVLFKNLKAGDAQTIASYVFEETRKFYSRFLG